jgi:predicted Zn-dependent peptidase
MINQYIYENGLKLIHEKPQSDLPITSIQIFCDIGSIYEKDGVRGAAHFIEHMCFKGTSKIPDGKEIFLNYNKIGAYFNANTEKRFTRYTVICQDEYFKNSFYILSDMLMNSTFKKKEFEKEINVVVEENIRNEDDANDLISMTLNKILYNGSSYENAIDTLSFHKKNTLKYEDVIEMYKMFYKPNRMVISIVSNLSFLSIKNMVKSSDFLKKHKNSTCYSDKYPKITTIVPQSTVQYNITKKIGVTTMHLNIGFRTTNHMSADKYILNVLSNIIGGNTSSRLFRLLREENGLTYSSSSYTTYYEHLGDLTIDIESDSHKIMKNGNKKGVLPLVITMLNDLLKNGIKQDELAMIKSNLKGSMILDIQNNDTSAFHNGLETLMGSDTIVPYCNLYEKYYASITKNDVNNIIRKYIKKENMVICLLGENVPSLESVKHECEKIVEK